MGKPTEQNCPLCGNPASYVFKDYKARKLFRCNTCNEFLIHEAAEESLKKQPSLKWLRDTLSKRASNSPPDRICFIRINPNQNEPALPVCEYIERA